MSEIKILIVASGNTDSVFVREQAEALVKQGVLVDLFYIKKKGIVGYLSSLKELNNRIKNYNPNLIHAHFGLTGLLANLQRKVPVVTTYHGCDINKLSLRLISIFSIFLSAYNIFVSYPQYLKIRFLNLKKFKIIPCGLNFNDFYPIPKKEAREKLGIDLNDKIILFSSSFDIPVKNYQLAQKAIGLLNEEPKLVELKGYSREEVNLIMNATDVGLLTSIREGSPMFVKELLATNTPIVATDVGDIKDRIEGIEGCFITDFIPTDIADKLTKALRFDKIFGREKINQLDNSVIAKEILEVYQTILK